MTLPVNLSLFVYDNFAVCENAFWKVLSCARLISVAQVFPAPRFLSIDMFNWVLVTRISVRYHEAQSQRTCNSVPNWMDAERGIGVRWLFSYSILRNYCELFSRCFFVSVFSRFHWNEFFWFLITIIADDRNYRWNCFFFLFLLCSVHICRVHYNKLDFQRPWAHVSVSPCHTLTHGRAFFNLNFMFSIVDGLCVVCTTNFQQLLGNSRRYLRLFLHLSFWIFYVKRNAWKWWSDVMDENEL